MVHTLGGAAAFRGLVPDAPGGSLVNLGPFQYDKPIERPGSVRNCLQKQFMERGYTAVSDADETLCEPSQGAGVAQW